MTGSVNLGTLYNGAQQQQADTGTLLLYRLYLILALVSSLNDVLSMALSTACLRVLLSHSE